MKDEYKYRLKPHDVFAIQWNGDNDAEIDRFVSYFGKHDSYISENKSFIAHFNQYEEYVIPMYYFIVNDNGKLYVKNDVSFMNKYYKVINDGI